MPGDGWCNLEGGIRRETRPSSSSLSESEMTSGGLGTHTPAALPCWTKPLGPGDRGELPNHRVVFKHTFMSETSITPVIYLSWLCLASLEILTNVKQYDWFNSKKGLGFIFNSKNPYHDNYC